MRMKWVLTALVVGLLGAAVTAGGALAHQFGADGRAAGHIVGKDVDGRQAALAAKVAAILGTDEQATAEAMERVRDEMKAEEAAEFRAAMEARLQDAVDRGAITREEADGILAAVESGDRTGGARFGKHGRHGRHCNHDGGGLGRGAAAQEYADRVGEVLAVDGARVADAVGQAGEALRSEAQEAMLRDVSDRVGAVLGIDGPTVADAITRAKDEAVEARLREAVDRGVITREEADDIRADLGAGGRFGPHVHGKRGGGHRPGSGQEFADRVGALLGVDGGDVADAFSRVKEAILGETLEAELRQAVATGAITPEEADAIRAKIAWDDRRGVGRHGHGRRGGFGTGGGGFGPSERSSAAAA